MNWSPIETTRLFLRPFELIDIDFLFEHFSSDYVCKYLVDEAPYTEISQAKGLISYFTDEKTKDATRWIIIEKCNGKRIGTCGYNLLDQRNNSIEVGYDMREEFVGNGFMTEAVTAIIKVAFEEKGMNRIQAHAIPENIRSCKLLKRLGFSREGTIREWLFFNGKYYDHYIYSVLRKEWENEKRRTNAST